MAARKPITAGDRFNNWTVIREASPSDRGIRMAECRCECGEVRILDFRSVRSGLSKSCGCLKHLAAYPEPGMKLCSKCRELKPIDNFHLNRNKGDGVRRPICADCSSKWRKAARECATPEEKEAALETARRWKRNNPEQVRMKQLAWNENNPEKGC